MSISCVHGRRQSPRTGASSWGWPAGSRPRICMGRKFMNRCTCRGKERSMEFDKISKRMLSSVVSEKLREVDERGTRMSELMANGRYADAVGEFTGIVRYQPEWAQFHFDILTYAVRK